jgi:hypothetical protein
MITGDMSQGSKRAAAMNYALVSRPKKCDTLSVYQQEKL